MFKYFITIAIFCILPFSSQAKYLGIDALPVQNKDLPVLFHNAFVKKDMAMINNLLNGGFSLKYSEDKFCALGYKPEISLNYLVQKAGDYTKSANIIKDAVTTAATDPDNRWHYFTDCNALPFVVLGMSHNDVAKWTWTYSNDAIKYMPSNQIDQNILQQQKSNLEYLQFFEDKLTPEQYDQYFPLVLNGDLPFEVRKKAAEKTIQYLKALNQKDEETIPAMQLQFIEQLNKETMPDDKKDNGYRAGNANKQINKATFFFTQLIKGYLQDTKNYTKMISDRLSAVRSQDNIIVPSQLKNEYDIPRYNVKALSTLQLSFDDSTFIKNAHNARLYFALQHAKENFILAHMFLASELVDLNLQDAQGNTLLQHISTQNYYNMEIGSLIRYLLENGADPKILNKNGDSPFAFFEKDRLSALQNADKWNTDIIQSIYNAYVQADFKD